MNETQIPDGPTHLWCPLWRKPMSKVCKTCPMWTLVRGVDSNSGKEIDRWNCALSFLPMLLIENSQMSRQTGAAVESFRNEVVRRSVVPAREIEREAVNHFAPPMIQG